MMFQTFLQLCPADVTQEWMVLGKVRLKGLGMHIRVDAVVVKLGGKSVKTKIGTGGKYL